MKSAIRTVIRKQAMCSAIFAWYAGVKRFRAVVKGHF